MDISDANADVHADEVERVLRELGVDQKPRILALNKADLLPVAEASSDGASFPVAEQIEERPGTVLVSALKSTGLDRLLEEVSRQIVLAEETVAPVAT